MSIPESDLNPQPLPPRTERLLSIDALRGFDMFWIVGGDELARALGKWWGTPEAVRRSPSSSSTSNGKGSGSTT